MKLEFLSKRLISLSTDIIAMVDSGNPKIVRIYEIGSTKQSGAFVEHGV